MDIGLEKIMGLTKPQGVKKKKTLRKKRRFKVTHDAMTQTYKLSARPKFRGQAIKIKVNRNVKHGVVEDRRHILHWDEHLRPIVTELANQLAKHSPNTYLTDIRNGLAAHGVKWLPLVPNHNIVKRLGTEINSAPGNLVPGSAAINQGIEKVRAALRAYQKALSEDKDYQDELMPGATMATRMSKYKQDARAHFIIGRTDTVITTAITDINTDILEMIDGCEGPAKLWVLLHDLTHSVTFDLSEKAKRQQTLMANAWLGQVRLLLSGDDPQKTLARVLDLLDA